MGLSSVNFEICLANDTVYVPTMIIMRTKLNMKIITYIKEQCPLQLRKSYYACVGSSLGGQNV